MTGETKAAGRRTVLRVMDILHVVAGRPDGCTLTDVAATLTLPKTSTFSLLKTLEGGGYLRQQQQRYLLGTEAIKLAAAVRQAVAFPRCARPVLDALAQETGETIMLGVLSDEGHEVMYVDMVESEAPLRFTVRTGNRRPLYAVASGKAILAFLSLAEQRAYLKRTSFVRFTGTTSDRAGLQRLLPEVRQQGVAVDADGIVDGATAVASPCFDATGAVACSVSVAGPTKRMIENRARMEALTRGAGEEISRILGYQGAYPPPVT